MPINSQTSARDLPPVYCHSLEGDLNTRKHDINIVARVYQTPLYAASSQVTVSPPPLLGTPASFFLLCEL